MSAILALFVGGFVTLVANVALQRWKYGREAIDRRCDEIERVALDLGAISREYWLRSWPEAEADALLGPSAIDLEFFATEARMVGLSQRIQGLNAIVISDFDEEQRVAVLRSLSVVLDQATGGRFEVRNRRQDFGRARGVEAACADYTVSLRNVATSRWGWVAGWSKGKMRARRLWCRFEEKLEAPCTWVLQQLKKVR